MTFRTYTFLSLIVTMMFGPPPLAAAQPTTASAAFNISPLRLELRSEQQSTRMLVRNESGKSLGVQVRVFSWDQKNGKDVYVPAKDVAVSPSIMKIDAERTQTFHILARGSAKGTGERRYRVVVDQLPDQTKLGPGLARTRLQMTLPLFVNSESASPASLTYDLTNTGLIIKNNGGRTARLSSLTIKQDNGSAQKLPAKGPKYIMGGSEILIALPSQFRCGTGNDIISGVIDKKKFDAVPAQNCS